MAIIHAIGRPENDSEREAIQYLKEHLPSGDEYVVFSNLELPNPAGFPFEYDIIVVGEYAVYTLEVKGYSGLIQGNASEWKLESGAIYKSPIPLANKKAKVLGERLKRHSPLLDQAFVWSLIVLSDEKARVHLNDEQAARVLHLKEAVDYILNPKRLPIPAKSITQLADHICEAIFKQFRPLSRQNEIGDYRIIDSIGKNKLYTTFLAEHRLLRPPKRFLLKVYTLNLYDTKEKRKKHEEWILRDSNALHRLAGHPNIGQAHLPFPWQDDHIVLPVEWVDGYSLRGLLDAKTVLPFSRKVDIVRQVTEGLAHAHKHKVIHRDLRPENIIVPDAGPVKIVNFDCARVEDDNLQTIATRVGRQLDERYVAPEVWQNAHTASPASDLYALGMLFFELLTGQTPYQNIKEVFAVKGLPRLPSQIDSTLPADADDVVARMCAFAPRERYQNIEEVIEDLKIIG